MNTAELITTIKPDLAMLCDNEEMTAERYAALSRIVGHLTPPNLLALVEALESAQIDHELTRGQLLIAHRTLLNQQARIAELEARTVTLPDAEKWRPVKEVVGQYSYRALVIKSLAAAGIKCEVKGE